ncbi:cysteine proteinase inhibitor 4 [Curcuma longa]|uniref:cysteine proteinase inhibitor 4 n=1 Tax=Curcuma longa TaxID=136217 RepID=UPI003D9E6EA7
MAMRLVLLFFFLLQALLLSAFRVSAGGARVVGGRTDVADVETNKEVQELGLFSVHEYNRRVVLGNNSDGRLLRRRPLVFSRVAAAQRQVVSGIKYFLRVEAGEEGRRRRRLRTFDAVVVVKPWLASRTLLSFSPGDDTGVGDIDA